METKPNAQKSVEELHEVIQRAFTGNITTKDYTDAVENLSKSNSSFFFHASKERLKIVSKQILRDSKLEIKIMITGTDDFVLEEDFEDEINIFLGKESSKLKIFSLHDIKNDLPTYLKKFIGEGKVEFVHVPSLILFWKNFAGKKKDSAMYPIISKNRIQVRYTDEEGKKSSFVSFRNKWLYKRILKRFENLTLGLENAV